MWEPLPSSWLPPCAQGPEAGRGYFSQRGPSVAATSQLFVTQKGKTQDLLCPSPRPRPTWRAMGGARGTILCLLDGKLQLPPQGHPLSGADLGPPPGASRPTLLLHSSSSSGGSQVAHPVLWSLALGPGLSALRRACGLEDSSYPAQPSPPTPVALACLGRSQLGAGVGGSQVPSHWLSEVLGERKGRRWGMSPRRAQGSLTTSTFVPCPHWLRLLMTTWRWVRGSPGNMGATFV